MFDRDRTTLGRSQSNYFCRTDNANFADFVRSRSNYFTHNGQRALSNSSSNNNNNQARHSVAQP